MVEEVIQIVAEVEIIITITMEEIIKVEVNNLEAKTMAELILRCLNMPSLL